MKRLTANEAKRITKRGMYRADPTLYLAVSRSGTKSWIQRLLIDGTRRDIGLGSFPAVSIVQARIVAMQNRAALSMGANPWADRVAARVERKRKASIPTFAAVNEVVYRNKVANWRSPVTARNWRQSMDRYVLPIIGHKPIDEIGREQVLSILSPIWTAKPEVSRKLRQRLVAVFEHASAHGHIELNPAGEVVNGALTRHKAVKAHFRALPYKDIPNALDIVDGSGAGLASKYALRFLVLTAARSGEVREARWSEIDGEVWKIPSDRMKSNREHRVPLSAPALDVLRKAKAIDDGSDLIFPSAVRTGRPLSNMSLTKVLRDNGLAEATTVHGLRSSFRDWCAESGKDREVAEAALAHVVGGTEGAYFRSDLFDRRRRLMQAWSDYLTDAERKVVQLHG